jgi:hypothetical protein
MLMNLPWTVLVINPVNAALNATEPEQARVQTRALIAKWGRLHAVRTALGFIAVIAFFVACLSH